MTAEEVLAVGKIEGQYLYVSDILHHAICQERPQDRGHIQIWDRTGITESDDCVVKYTVGPESFRSIEPYLRLPEGL